MLTFKSYLDEGVNDPAIFKAVFLAGGPGSGKSFIVGKTALTSLGFKLINSDIAFERSLEKAGLDKGNPDDIYSKAGQLARISAKALTDKQMNLAVQGRLGLVIDGTGKDFDKIKKQAIALKKIGYEVSMIFVNTDQETAMARNNKRARKLPDEVVSKMWKQVQNNIGKFQNLFGNMMIVVDNSDNANYEGGIRSAYRKMAAFAKIEPRMPQAKAWIQGQKKK
jgi:tRNA uridine 5-carbamoylmethylation protein Kti12